MPWKLEDDRSRNARVRRRCRQRQLDVVAILWSRVPNLWRDWPLINPRMGHRFLLGSAFLRRPLLTLNVAVCSETQPRRLMLGGGREKGSGGGGSAQARPIWTYPHTRVKLRKRQVRFYVLA
jgi:hypothetical protein